MNVRKSFVQFSLHVAVHIYFSNTQYYPEVWPANGVKSTLKVDKIKLVQTFCVILLCYLGYSEYEAYRFRCLKDKFICKNTLYLLFRAS